MDCASAYFCHDFLVFPLTCTRDGARLHLETERMIYLKNPSNAVSVMNFARGQSMPIPLPWSSLIHTGHRSLDMLIIGS